MAARSGNSWGAALLAVVAGACYGEPLPYPNEPSPTTEPPTWAPAAPCDGAGPCDGVEACDGYDNNGDGRVDEECYCEAGATQLCYPGPAANDNVGSCRSGVQRCEHISSDFLLGSWGACVGAVLPQREICGNHIDEDCDGGDLPCEPAPTGECAAGMSQPCYHGPKNTAGKGICTAGMQQCQTDGAWGQCLGAITPATEICNNGIDEDCDGEDLDCNTPVCTPGMILPCYPGADATLGVGVCSAGQAECDSNGQWGQCLGAVLPSVEVCHNDKDDDCNTIIDDCE